MWALARDDVANLIAYFGCARSVRIFLQERRSFCSTSSMGVSYLSGLGTDSGLLLPIPYGLGLDLPLPQVDPLGNLGLPYGFDMPSNKF